MGPAAPVAAVRLAVRRSLAGSAGQGVLAGLAGRGVLAGLAGRGVLVACSGGADSLALAAATAFEARRAEVRAGAITVDHGLQHGSGERAESVAATLRGLGLDPVHVVRVVVGANGGPEAAARSARYDALAGAAAETGAAAVLLGHTRDDQAETVLLGLARGSGARSLSGMAPVAGLYRRPLLTLARAEVRAACLAEGLTPWDDPHNLDPAFARVRVRTAVLPLLEQELGGRPGRRSDAVARALARTAELLREDADALDEWAARTYPLVVTGSPPVVRLDVATLAEVPRAVCTRVLRMALVAAGAPATDLTADHVGSVARLLTDWHGQGPLHLPGSVRVVRRGEHLEARSSDSGSLR